MENRFSKIVFIIIFCSSFVYSSEQLRIEANNIKVNLDVCKLEIPDEYKLKFLNRRTIFFEYLDKNSKSKIYAKKYFNINISRIDRNNSFINKRYFIEIDKIKFKNFTTKIYKFKDTVDNNKISLYTIISKYIVNMNIKKERLNVFLDILKNCDNKFLKN